MLVVSYIEYLEFTFNGATPTFGLVLQDFQAKAVVLRHNANEDSACSRARIAHSIPRVGSGAHVNLFNGCRVYLLPAHRFYA
jgi:hypothetical protein